MKYLQPRRAVLAFALVALWLPCGARVWAQEAADGADDPPGALPFDLAFDPRAFLHGESPAVSPDGERVAFTVRSAPPDRNLDARFQPNGTPSSVVGSKIQVVGAAGGEPTFIGPEGASSWRPSWSPDGTRLAFYSDAGGSPQLWLHDLDAGQARRVSALQVKAKLWSGDHARWSPGGTTLFVPLSPSQDAAGEGGSGEGTTDSDLPTVTVLGSGSEVDAATSPSGNPRASFMMQENNASLAAIGVASGDVRVLVDAETMPRPSVLRLSPSGRWLTYLSVFIPGAATSQSSTYALAAVPSAGGDVVVLAEELPVGRDYHGQNYSWHPFEDQLVYLKDDGLYRVEFGEEGPGVPQRLGESLGPLAPVPLWFARDGEAVVVGTRPLDYQDYMEERPRGLALIPLEGGTSREVPFTAEWEYQSIVRMNETTLWQPEAGTATVLLRHALDGESAIARATFDEQAEAGGSLEVLWKGIARFRGFGSADHDSLTAVYEDVSTPPDVRRFDARLSAAQRLSRIDDRLDGIARPTAEIFEVEAPLFDGTIDIVRTAILLPEGAKRGDRLPGIVLIYPGGDVSRHVERYGGGSTISLPTQLLVSRGYAVILPHLKLGPNGEAGQPAQEMVDVLLPQVYKAAELGYVDIARLGIAGHSFGGYGTAAILSRTNLFRAAVAISGIYDLGGTYGHLGDGYSGFWVGWSEGGQARMGNHPWADVRRYLDNSPYYQADKIRTPLLLIHGDQDSAYHDAEKLFTALRRLDRDAQLSIYHGQGHVVSTWNRKSAADAARRLVTFFDKHLAAQR